MENSLIVREEGEVVKVDGKNMERAMGFEPTTFCLGSKHSTTELRPPIFTLNYSVLLFFG